MNHILKLRLEIEGSDDTVEATRDVDTTRDAIALIAEYLHRFAEPDAGPQTITITLMSTHDPHRRYRTE